VNIFEGTRRVVKLITVLSVLGFLAYAVWGSDPYLTATYTIAGIGETPTQHSICEPNAVQDWITVKTKKGADVHVTLCFMAKMNAKIIAAQEIAKRGIQSKIPPDGQAYFDKLLKLGIIRLYDETDSLQQGYLDQAKARARIHVKETFELPQSDQIWFDKQKQTIRRENIQEGALVLVGGLTFLWVFTWTTGWIVRGYLGIPMGKDSKFNNELCTKHK